jgi:hypothetical protein
MSIKVNIDKSDSTAPVASMTEDGYMSLASSEDSVATHLENLSVFCPSGETSRATSLNTLSPSTDPSCTPISSCGPYLSDAESGSANMANLLSFAEMPSPHRESNEARDAGLKPASFVLCATDSRVFYAGEATHDVYRGTVHGAFLSGIREADRILSSLNLPAVVR